MVVPRPLAIRRLPRPLLFAWNKLIDALENHFHRNKRVGLSVAVTRRLSRKVGLSQSDKSRVSLYFSQSGLPKTNELSHRPLFVAFHFVEEYLARLHAWTQFNRRRTDVCKFQCQTPGKSWMDSSGGFDDETSSAPRRFPRYIAREDQSASSAIPT